MHTDVQPMLTCEECGKTLKGKKGLKVKNHCTKMLIDLLHKTS